MAKATAKKVAAPPELPHKDFAKRLLVACENNPYCPTEGRGKQKWLRDKIEEKFGVGKSASQESFSKYFMGETRPKTQLMNRIAETLEVDVGWLSLGIRGNLTPRDTQRHNAMSSGAANIVAGSIQLAGGHVAFPDASQSSEVDLFAIIGGRQVKIEVRLARMVESDVLRFDINAGFESRIVFGVVAGKPLSYPRILRLSSELIKERGKRRGDFWLLNVTRDGSKFYAGSTLVPEVTDFQKLEVTL